MQFYVIRIWLYTGQHLPFKDQEKALSYPMLVDFRKDAAFWKVLRFRPFVRLLRAGCR